MKRRVDIRVSLLLPEGFDPSICTPEDARDYVGVAVRTMMGCLQPPYMDGGDTNTYPIVVGDPMFMLDPSTVQVSLMRKKKST